MPYSFYLLCPFNLARQLWDKFGSSAKSDGGDVFEAL